MDQLLNVNLEDATLTSNESEYVIKHDVPGVKREDVSLTVDDGRLKFSAKRYDNGRTYVKAYVLPTDVDVNAIDAILEHGIITVKLKRLKKNILKVLIK